MNLENRIMKQENFEEFALPLVQDLSSFIKVQRNTMRIELKEDHSFVTNLDKEVELKLRDAFSKKYNDLTIIGEEFGDVKGSSDYSLYIDPIDGTSAFISKGYDYAISLGILKNGVPEFGLVYDVANDIYYMNGKTNQENKNSSLLLIQGNPLVQELNFEGMQTEYIQGFSTALGLVRTSSDTLRAYVQTSNNLNLWDVVGALGYLKYCDNIVVDFLDEGTFSDQNFLEKNKISGIVSYKEKDLYFTKWYQRNRFKLKELL